MVKRSAGVSVFVEGGGRGDSSIIECRKAFSRLIERAGFQGRMPNVVACGSRGQAFDYFQQACKEGTRDSLLLVDSEGPVTQESPWEHVRRRQGDGATTTWRAAPGFLACVRDQ